MFSFARQKRTRKAPATFDAREARPGCHPGPQSGGRRDKIGRCAYGTDAFSDFAPAPIGSAAHGFGKGGKFAGFLLGGSHRQQTLSVAYGDS